MAVTLNIVDWKAWHCPSDDRRQPDLASIPPLLRRRLSRQGRAAISVILALTDRHGAMPVVYVSRHGELNRTARMLQALAADEPLSPTAFSLSVHNATAGLYSILRKNTASMTAIAAGRDDLVPALLEAHGMLGAGTERVLCVFCDDTVPDLYTDYCSQPQALYACAVIIGAGEQLRLEATAAAASCDERTRDEHPQGLQLYDWLNGRDTALNVLCNGAWWRLQRNAP